MHVYTLSLTYTHLVAHMYLHCTEAQIRTALPLIFGITIFSGEQQNSVCSLRLLVRHLVVSDGVV